MLLRKLFRRVLTISFIVIALCPLVYSRPQVDIESPRDETHTPEPAVVENVNTISVTGTNGTRYNTSFKEFMLNYYHNNINVVSRDASYSNVGKNNNLEIKDGNIHNSDEVYGILGEYTSKEFQRVRKKRNISPIQFTSESRRQHYEFDREIANSEPKYGFKKNYSPVVYGRKYEEESFVTTFRSKEQGLGQNRILGYRNTSPVTISQNNNNQRLNILNANNDNNPIKFKHSKNLSHSQLESLQRLQRRLRPYKNGIITSDSFNNNYGSNHLFSQNEERKPPKDDKKPIIRKIFTQWTDSTNFDDIHRNMSKLVPKSSEKNSSLKNAIIFSTSENSSHKNYLENKYSDIFINYKPYPVPRPQTVASSGTHVFSNNIQVVDEFDAYGKPTPLVAYARPSIQNSHSVPTSYPTIIRKPSTSVPLHLAKPPFKYPSFHNSINNLYPISSTVNPFSDYKPDAAESHTTFPISTFTDTVIIRPEDYNSASNKCPTITLKLNNTIKSKSQEICPDLNIAINTQVVNKNVVVEDSEELDSQESGIEGDDSNESNKESESNEYSSEDSTEESAFFSNAPASLTSDSEVENFANAGSSSEVASGSQLVQNEAEFEEDEEESFLDTWMGPTTTMMNWLAILNPFNFGVWSLVLAPLAVVLAGGSGLSALLAPWGIPYGRSVLNNGVENGSNKLFWDERHNSWDWINFSGDETWRIIDPRSFPEYNIDEQTKNKFGSLIRRAKMWVIKAISETVLKSFGLYSHHRNSKNNETKKEEKWKTKRRRK